MTPRSAPVQCVEPGCSKLTTHGGRCSSCRKEASGMRPAPRAQGYDAQWQRDREKHLKLEPFCRYCPPGTQGVDVDHVVPHRGEIWLLRAAWNLQTLCRSCHSKKTASEGHGVPIGMRYPLGVRRPQRPTRLFVGVLTPAVILAKAEVLVQPWNEAGPAFDEQLRSAWRRDGPLIVAVAAPRAAERRFWEEVLGSWAEVMLPASDAREWWRLHDLDVRAMEAIDARAER